MVYRTVFEIDQNRQQLKIREYFNVKSNIMTVQSIEKYLKTQNLNIEIQDTLTSTNTVLKEYAEQGAPEGTILFARQQTGGKGRLGRSFYSPEETGIYLSILLRPKVLLEEALLITTCAAVAVAETLEEETGQQCKIKWVNDVFCEGKKVCGILTEAAIDPEYATLKYAVLGIGINLFPPEEGFPEELAEIAGSVISKRGNMADLKSKIAAGVIDCFFAEYQHLTEKRFLDKYRDYSLITGRAIDVIRGGNVRKAHALGIDDNFRLLVRYENGMEQAVETGEVSIRI